MWRSAIIRGPSLESNLENGYFQAHLKRMRGIYRQKRDRLLQLLDASSLPLAVRARPAGMHATILLEADEPDEAVVRRMAESGFETLALSRHYLAPNASRNGLLAGFTSANGDDLPDFVAALSKCLQRSW